MGCITTLYLKIYLLNRAAHIFLKSQLFASYYILHFILTVQDMYVHSMMGRQNMFEKKGKVVIVDFLQVCRPFQGLHDVFVGWFLC